MTMATQIFGETQDSATGKILGPDQPAPTTQFVSHEGGVR
jgi:hypothetical protein